MVKKSARLAASDFRKAHKKALGLASAEGFFLIRTNRKTTNRGGSLLQTDWGSYLKGVQGNCPARLRNRRIENCRAVSGANSAEKSPRP